MFKNEDGVYKKRNMQNVNDARMGNSVEWHAIYSKGRTEFMGFIAPRVTSPVFGMGDCERGWGVIKCIKYGKSAKITVTGVKKEKLSIISTNNKLNKARIKREELE